jgi:acyl-CoA thioester hydrolase
VPLIYPDTIKVGVRVSEYYEFGFIQEFAIISLSKQVIAATGSGRIVTYDYIQQRKVPVPPDLLTAVERLEGRCIERSHRSQGTS